MAVEKKKQSVKQAKTFKGFFDKGEFCCCRLWCCIRCSSRLCVRVSVAVDLYDDKDNNGGSVKQEKDESDGQPQDGAASAAVRDAAALVCVCVVDCCSSLRKHNSTCRHLRQQVRSRRPWWLTVTLRRPAMRRQRHMVVRARHGRLLLPRHRMCPLLMLWRLMRRSTRIRVLWTEPIRASKAPLVIVYQCCRSA